jgi:hypothetical protein
MAVAQSAKHMRIRVIDHEKEGKPAVNIKMPVSVVRWGMKMAKAYSPQLKDVDVDWDGIDTMIKQGEVGKLVEVEDEAQHKTVEIWVE